MFLDELFYFIHIIPYNLQSLRTDIVTGSAQNTVFRNDGSSVVLEGDRFYATASNTLVTVFAIIGFAYQAPFHIIFLHAWSFLKIHVYDTIASLYLFAYL
jgi:hypothetical protein